MEINLNVQEIVIRYVFMMGVVIMGVLIEQWWLAFFALPIFLTAITGMCPMKTLLKKT